MAKIKKFYKKYIKKYFSKEKLFYFINTYKYLLFMALPLLVLDLGTRIFNNKGGLLGSTKFGFFGFYQPVPNLFTIIWITLFIGIALTFKRKVGKKIYVGFFGLALLVFIVNNIYYSVANNFFDFSLLGMASEGSSYIIDAIKKTKFWIIPCAIIAIYLCYLGVKHIPERKRANYKILSKALMTFIIGHLFIPVLLGSANSDLTWSTWRNARNIYDSFNDSNKSMMVSGLYEYTFRNFYITYLKEKEKTDDKEIEFLEDAFDDTSNNEVYQTEYTGLFKDKNVIFLQLEGIDNWLVTEDIMPNLYSLTNNAFNFNNHYSYYNGGGSTFNSEFAVNTGYITPISYTQNAYTYNKHNFTYSLANLFKNAGYVVNAFHMNSAEYYSRGINYENWGYDNYYGLKDIGDYKHEEYNLDTELLLNETFYEEMLPTDTKFVSYVITYSNHMPFTTNKGVCKQIVDKINEQREEEDTDSELIGDLSEEECVRLQAKETDDMIGLLIQALKDKGLIDNTVIVAYADHYLYTLVDQSILAKYKDTSNNLINHTPLLIWSNNMERKDIEEVTSQLNILPTTLNLFGLEYHPNYYIGDDALNPDYQGIVFFSDYSWYDGNVYVSGGVVANGGSISDVDLSTKNYYINYIIKKNDLTLKYDYFDTIVKQNKEKEKEEEENSETTDS